MNLFAAYREVVIRGDEIVHGVLHPGVDPDDPPVRRAFDEWGGARFFNRTPHGVEVTLIRSIRPPRRERWWLHLLLLLATLLTTSIAGAYFVGRDPLPLGLFPVGAWAVPVPIQLHPGELVPGLAFSLPLLLILLGHEAGHFVLAKRHRMDVSPPYFIPCPNWVNLIGTFGAFIRLRSPMINRIMLLDVGVAGPLVSFVLSVPAILLGVAWSEPVRLASLEPVAPYVVFFAGQPLWLGDSLLLNLLAGGYGPEGSVLLLHPLAFAGWLGLFVTALNLFPLAQLDGGHILYALVGRRQHLAGIGFLVLLAILGQWWWGWWFWAVMILILGRGSIRHPPVFDPALPLDPTRRWLGWACVLIFGLTFMPIPIEV